MSYISRNRHRQASPYSNWPHSTAFFEFYDNYDQRYARKSRATFYAVLWGRVVFKCSVECLIFAFSHYLREGRALSSDCLVGRGRKHFAPCCRVRGEKREGFKPAFSRQHSHRGRASGKSLRYDLAVNYTVIRVSFAPVSLSCSPSCLLATPAVGRWALLMNGATCLWNSDIAVGFHANLVTTVYTFLLAYNNCLRRRNVGFALVCFFFVCLFFGGGALMCSRGMWTRLCGDGEEHRE